MGYVTLFDNYKSMATTDADLEQLKKRNSFDTASQTAMKNIDDICELCRAVIQIEERDNFSHYQEFATARELKKCADRLLRAITTKT